MKTLLLALSLAANLFLLFGPRGPAAIVGSRARASEDSAAGAEPGSEPAGRAPARRFAAWTSLTTGTPAEIAARLRASGISDAAARAGLAAFLAERVDARRVELQGPPVDAPYWKQRTAAQMAPLLLKPEALAELRQMSRENGRLVTELFGPDPLALDSMAAMQERLTYGALPADKVAQLKLIAEDYGELRSAITLGAQGVYFAEDRERLALLQREEEKDIRALLSPEEYEEFRLRSSSTAESMRRTLAEFRPSEAEFRAIFALQEEFDRQYVPLMPGGMTPEMSRNRAAAQTELNGAIAAALTPERAAEYERLTDPLYRQAAAVAAQLRLPTAAATELWTIQRETQQRATVIRQTPMNAATRREQLEALQGEATGRLRKALGGDGGLDTYRRQGGQWLQNLVPVTAPPMAPGGRGP